MTAQIKHLAVAGIASLIMVTATHSAPAATAIFQDGLNGYAGTEDNQLLDPGTGFHNANVGGRNTFQLGNGSPITTRRTILRFDITSLTGRYISIDSATITLKKSNSPAGPGTDDAEMYAIADDNADWVEGNSIFVETAGESSWNSKRHGEALWIGEAGGGTLGALQDTLVGVSSNDPVNTLYTFDLEPALVEQWITGVNAGVLMKEGIELDDFGSGTELQIDWYSSEFGDLVADAPQHPRLEITYTAPVLTGDFNNDDVVDAADYTLWQDNLGDADEWAINEAGDGLNGITRDDYDVWVNNFGNTTAPGSTSATAIPEPTTVLLAGLSLVGLLVGASRRKGKLSDEAPSYNT